MKCEKGITLTALVIYVIVFVFIIGIVSTVTSYFYNNVINFDETTKSYVEINKFNMYFLQDIKSNDVIFKNFIKKDEVNTGITLYNTKNFETVSYNFENNSIYRNGILISKNIKNVKIEIEDNKVLSIFIQTEGTAGYAKTIKYSID